MLISGNNNIQSGRKQDTGRKWVDASGVPHPIFEKALLVSALPNATLKNVAHGETINVVSKYANVTALWASNGTNVKTLHSSGITIELTATNVAITTATDLSLFINGVVVIEFCA